MEASEKIGVLQVKLSTVTKFSISKEILGPFSVFISVPYRSPTKLYPNSERMDTVKVNILHASGKWIHVADRPKNIYDFLLAACISHANLILLK